MKILTNMAAFGKAVHKGDTIQAFLPVDDNTAKQGWMDITIPNDWTLYRIMSLLDEESLRIAPTIKHYRVTLVKDMGWEDKWIHKVSGPCNAPFLPFINMGYHEKHVKDFTTEE